jgi:tetratricopeptide (TPR) repeat protein
MTPFSRIASGLLVAIFAARGQSAASAKEEALERLSQQASSQQRRGDYKAAAETYRKIDGLQPGSPEVQSNLGLMYHLQEDYRAAVECFEKALRLNPHLFAPNFFLGTDLLKLGESGRAIPYLQAAAKLKPEDEQAALRLAQALAGMRRFEEANSWYQKSVSLNTRNADSWFGLGITYLKIEQLAAEQLRKLSSGASFSQALLAEALFEQGRPADAARLYRGILNASAAPPCLRASLGAAYLKGGKPDEAAKVFAQQRDTGAACLSADASREDPRARLAAADDVLSQDPANSEMLYWKIKSAQQLALNALTEAARANPESHRVHLLLGDAYREQGKLFEAIAEYKQSLSLMPGDVAGDWGLARTYYQRLDFDQTLAELAIILRDHPADPEANYMLSYILVARQRFHDAEPSLKMALAGPASQVPHTHALLAKVYAAAGDTNRAIKELKEALPADEDGAYHFRISQIYKRTGNQKAASEALKQAKAIRQKRSETQLSALNDPEN